MFFLLGDYITTLKYQDLKMHSTSSKHESAQLFRANHYKYIYIYGTPPFRTHIWYPHVPKKKCIT